uniref:Uncharacterized protein n=1 Tax=Tetradesmus obliquus TaxID=3088 RepID=A0A383W4Y3_TETOB|eukprot:jgi/Sobl393_1/16155/SZX72199.1
MQQSQGGHQVVVMDNGAGSIKLGFEGEATPRLVFPNCTAKPKGERQLYVGDALLEARELGGMVLRRPHDRGFMVNYDLERDIWQRGFASLAAAAAAGQLQGMGSGPGGGSSSSKSKAALDCRAYSLLLTEPLFNFDAVRAATEEIVFEEFGFNSLLAAPAPFFSLHHICNIPVTAQPAPQQPLSIPGVPAAAGSAGGQVIDSAEAALATYGAPVRALSAAGVAALTAAKAAGAGVIIDAGFSAAYAVPFFDGQLLPDGVRRLGLGGKALTNLLKETVSYRSLNMADEGLLMERLKDQLCWVSQDAVADLHRSNPLNRSPHRRDVVLPDGVHNLRGYVNPPTAEVVAALSPGGKHHGIATGPWPAKPQHIIDVEKKEAAERAAAGAAEGGSSKQRAGGPSVSDQVLQLNNELFMVPEALFRPSDIGLQQAGMAEVVMQAVAACPPGLAPLLYGQVVLTGGCCNLPGFAARFECELRTMVPSDFELVVLAPQEPELTAWQGASAFAAGDNYWQCVRTKQQYEEQGGGRRDR